MTKVVLPSDASQEHRKHCLLDLYRTISVFTFPLIVTPEKLMVSSSGHLDVQIKNPTSRPFHVTCSIKSFAFVLESAKDHEDTFEKETKQIKHKIEPDGVLNLKIKYEDDFNGIKKTGRYDNAEGHFSIEGKGSYTDNPDDKIDQEEVCIDLNAEKVLLLSGDPKKMKSIMEKYAEIQAYQERLRRLEGIYIDEDIPSNDYEDDECYQKQIDFENFKKEKEERFQKVLAKYGSKLDQMTNEQIKEAKKEEARKQNEEKMKKEGNSSTASKNKKKKKKCVVM